MKHGTCSQTGLKIKLKYKICLKVCSQTGLNIEFILKHD
jgi:hypothetical protein